ncbi:hypothetical protein [Alterinioella nitratireducens]|nr:hypothetical protein [Alterinioella nitratireducens]
MKALEYAADATADIEAIWDYTYDAALEVRIRGVVDRAHRFTGGG